MEKNVKKHTLSVCMMVKNEEKNLERSLSSIQDIADEIIVVDTGSSDRSPEICEHYGAQVFYHPWENNFSLHRNQSIHYASGEWLLILDADEEFWLVDRTADQFKADLFSIPNQYMGAAIPINDIQKEIKVTEWISSRFFRNGLIEYKDIIQNQPIVYEKGSLSIDGALIRHYGYDLTPEAREQKTIRTKTLLFKRIDLDPNDYMAYFYLNQLFAANRDFANAVMYGEKYFEFKNQAVEDKQFMSAIYYTMCHAFINLKDVDNAKRWLMIGSEALPYDIDIARCIVEFGAWQKKRDMVVTGARNFMRLWSQYHNEPSMKGNRFTYSLNAEAASYVLFTASVALFDEGITSIEMLTGLLPETQTDYQKGMIQDIQSVVQAVQYATENMLLTLSISR